MGTRRPESSLGVTDKEEVKSIAMDHGGGKREGAMVSPLGGCWHLSWRQGDPICREGEKESSFGHTEFPGLWVLAWNEGREMNTEWQKIDGGCDGPKGFFLLLALFLSMLKISVMMKKV